MKHEDDMLRCDAPVIRVATALDVDRLEALIPVSARELSRACYSAAQIEAAIAHVFGVDAELIEDGTYFCAELGGELVGCGGWSRRRTLFGGDQYVARDSAFSDPAVDPAKIRAFFVHPRAARRGIGRALLAQCEEAAKAFGYCSAELMSTLPGVDFYRGCGYAAGRRTTFLIEEGVAIDFVPMTKNF